MMRHLLSTFAMTAAFAGLTETYNPPVLPGECEEYDVIVVGGTSAGVSAALGAGAAGARVLVLTARPALLDDMTGHLLLDCPNPRWKGGVFNDNLYNILGGPFVQHGDVTPLQLKRLGDELLMRSGIPFKTFVSAVDVLKDGTGAVCGVRIASRSGERTIRARAVVDATERAQLARRAGARFKEFAGGEIAFERRIVSGEPPSAKGLSVRELPSRNGAVAVQGVSQCPVSGGMPSVVTGRFYSCSFTLPMKDLSARSLAEAEQVARDLTWTKTTLDASDTLRFFPPDRIVESVPGVFVASVVGEADEAAARRRFANVFDDSPAAADIGRAAAEFSRSAAPSPEQPAPAAATALPVLASADVFVAGLGTGGAPAAIAASRSGAKVIGCDFLHVMGGLMTEGLIGNYCYGCRIGFTAEIDKALKGFAAVYSVSKGEWFRREARKAGAELWFGAWATGVVVEGGRIAGVKVVLADGTVGQVRAKAFIDATGNADLAAAAGEETEFVRKDELSLQGAGSTQVLLGASYRNTDWSFVDDTDVEDLHYFTLRARNSMSLWAWDQAQMVNSRERRRLRGAYSVSVQDALLGRTYPDIIAVTSSNFDTHGQTFDEQFFIEDPGHGVRNVNLPYRCLLPKKLDGLLVVGLGMSAHRDAMPILRMQPDVQNQGYAAGLAAAMSVADGVELRHVDIAKLQAKLVEKGCIPRELAGARDSFPLPDARFDEAVGTLPNQYDGLTVLLSDPARAVPRLRAAYRATDVERDRLVYAHVLGLLGDGTGAAALVSAVESSSSWDKGWNYKGMDQFGRSVSWLDSYVIALGRTKSPAAFDVLCAKARLLAPSSDYSHFRALSLAFESLGNPCAKGEFAHLLNLPGVGGHALAKSGIPVPSVPGYDRFSHHNAGLGDAERNDCLRELCLARALYNLGDEDWIGEKTLEAYAADPRRAYANHARKVLSRPSCPGEWTRGGCSGQCARVLQSPQQTSQKRKE